MRNKGAGLEWRSGTVTKNNPVNFHKHPAAHVLVPGNHLKVDTESRGTITLKPNEPFLIFPNEFHKLRVNSEPANYTCVGFEGQL